MEMFVKAKLLVPLPAASLILGSNLGPEPYPWGDSSLGSSEE